MKTDARHTPSHKNILQASERLGLGTKFPSLLFVQLVAFSGYRLPPDLHDDGVDNLHYHGHHNYCSPPLTQLQLMIGCKQSISFLAHNVGQVAQDDCRQAGTRGE